MVVTPEVESQIFAEGIEVDSREYPEVAERIAREYGAVPRSHSGFGTDDLTVFRGDNEKVFQELLEDGDLKREFPIYFTDSEDAAITYADRKYDDSDRMVLEMNVPYSDVEVFEGRYSDVERGDADLTPGKLHFIGANMGPGSTGTELEFVATEIPEEWYSVRWL